MLKKITYCLTVLAAGIILICNFAACGSEAAAPVFISTVAINIAGPVKGEMQNTRADTNGSGYTLSEVIWSPEHEKFLGGTVYTASLTLTAKNAHSFAKLQSSTVNGQAAMISDNNGAILNLFYTFPPTPVKTVTVMAITTQPAKMIYTHGDPLDLAGLEVTLTYDDATLETVAASGFAAKGISTNLAQSTFMVSLTHNAQPITITLGDLPPLATSALTVNPRVIPFTVDPIAAQPYTGTALLPDVNVRDGAALLTLNADYGINYSDNINAGTALVAITGMGNYTGSSGTANFDINASIVTFIIDSIAAQSYTGSALEPVIAVKDCAKALILNTDYTLSFLNNLNIGTASVTVTGIANYAGSFGTANFIVEPRIITFTVDPISDYIFNGIPHTPELTVRDGAAILELNTDYTVSYSDNTNAGNAAVNISGIGNYAGSSVIVYFTILPTAEINAYYWVDQGSLTFTSDNGTLSLARGLGQSVLIEPQEKGYSEHRWFVNGEEVSGLFNPLEFTFSSIGRPLGRYTVGLSVKKDGAYYYAEILITVTNQGGQSYEQKK